MSPPKRHIPLRSCVVCGAKRSKRELIRIVATPLGPVEVDLTGKGHGRGAYVCGDTGCARGSLRRNRIEYALRRRLTDEDWLKVLSSTEALGSATAPGATSDAS
jgi:predicted RNA-binding protein YlxR (DUF448 family)